MIDPSQIAAYCIAYKQLRARCRMIIPSCREGNVCFKWLAECRAYMAWMLALYTVERKINEKNTR